MQQLQQKIGYTFKNESLLTTALSHRSYGKDNNERLEFLGDSIINFIAAHALFAKHSDAAEGDLSRMRSSLVKGDTLAKVAKEFELGEYLKLGPGEMKSGGFKRSSILAGALEALIGAIFIDAGFAECHRVVMSWFEQRVADTDVENIYKDNKTLLQECLQAKKLPLPEYKLIKTTGVAHKQTFYVECHIESIGKIVKDKGMSRRKAEQNAAKKMLKVINNDG